jgi:hypothetical protein
MKQSLVISSLALLFALGWFANDVLQTQKAHGAASRTYRVERIQDGTLENLLNTAAQEGWRFHSTIVSSSGAAAIFER